MSNKRKKRLIQLMVPKLVLDEKQDQLFLFINPFLENSCKNSIEKIDEFEGILPKSLIQTENEGSPQTLENSLEILSQRGKNVRVADEWRTTRPLHELISSNRFVKALRHFISIHSLRINFSSLKNTSWKAFQRGKLPKKFFPQKLQYSML